MLSCKATQANLLVMDVARAGEGTFDLRLETVKTAKRGNPEIKAALLCDNVSDESVAYKVKCSKEEAYGKTVGLLRFFSC